MHFTDINNFNCEWELDELPWDAVTAVDLGHEHPENIDEKLVDAITNRALGTSIETEPRAKAAAIAFLYVYMILAHGGEKYVLSWPIEMRLLIALSDLRSILLPDLLYRSALVLAPPPLSPPV